MTFTLFKELLDFMQTFSNRVAIYRKSSGTKSKKRKKLTTVEKQLARLTMTQLVEFVDVCKEKYMKGKTINIQGWCWSNQVGVIFSCDGAGHSSRGFVCPEHW